LVTLAAAKGGVVTGILLALARIMGEAAPLLLTAFGNQFMAQGPLDKSNSLPQLIFIYSTGAFPEWHAQAWGAALILIALVLGINVVVRWLTRQRY
jgi:phosphate transport system permease protein